MNELGTTLVWLALQVTLVSLAAAALYAVPAPAAGRPGGGAAGLAASVALTAAALCPLPSWWGWGTEAAPAAAVVEAGTPFRRVRRRAHCGRSGSEGRPAAVAVARLRGCGRARAARPRGPPQRWASR